MGSSRLGRFSGVGGGGAAAEPRPCHRDAPPGVPLARADSAGYRRAGGRSHSAGRVHPRRHPRLGQEVSTTTTD
eukprot:1835663-Pyramimonas_sp.AAC.1